MHLDSTAEQRALRADAAAFCAGLRPLLESDPEWWRQGMLSDGDSVAVNRALGEAGWIGMSWPVELGGRGLSRLDGDARRGGLRLPLAAALLVPPLLQDDRRGDRAFRLAGARGAAAAADRARRARLLPGFSEPGAGSDLGSLTTRAELRGDTYVVTGHKIWTSSAQLADWIYLAVRTDPDAKHRGISVLVCPVDTPGIEVRAFPDPRRRLLCETFLDGVEIPATNLVGEVNGGWDILMYTLDFERVTAEKLGGFAWVLDAVEERLRETDRLDRAASEKIARLRGELHASRLLSFRAADMLDRGLPGSATSAMAKLSGARLAQAIGDAAVDLLGLEGLGDASPDAAIQGRAAALYRASVGSTIAGGTAEVQQLVIARRGLGLR